MIAVVVIALVSCLECVSGFSFLGDIKLPNIQNFQKSIDSNQKFGNNKICVITGTSSGLGKQTCKHLLTSGGWHIVCAVRDVDKMSVIAEFEEMDQNRLTIMECDLNSFASVRKFADDLKQFKADRPIDRLVLNAAVYQPSLPTAKWSEDGIEQQIQTNYLSHLLLTSLLLPDMREAKGARVIAVGSVTGNDNTVGGGGVYPVADLRDLEGLAAGLKQPVEMMDGYPFNGAKAYKDSKLCLMMMTNKLHDKYHRATGISFSSIYPGCIAESPLFREKRPWFRKLFPLFMRYVTGGFVNEVEAGERLYQVIVDPRCSRSGVYWSWNGGPRMGRGVDALKNRGGIVGAGGEGGGWESIYENDQSDKVLDTEKAEVLFKLSSQVTEADWMPAKSPKSPCPTLVVISAVTALLDQKEKLKKKPTTMREAMGQLAF